MVSVTLLYYYANLNDRDFLLLLALLAVMVIGAIAQARVQSVFRKYDKISANNGRSAADVANALLRSNNSSVGVAQTAGSLTDNFNPRTGVVSLSQSVYSSGSIAAMAVAAHEVGHVMQYESDYTPIRIRNSLLPLASFGSRFSYLIVIVGLFMGSIGNVVCFVGIGLFTFAFLFQLITLPVELNASKRALEMLSQGGYITGAEQENGARKVLNAAACTYLVAAIASLLSLLRLMSLASRRRN